MFSYRQMLLQSFKIAWKNKYLWFFGLFASLLSIGAEYQILTRAMNRGASLEWFYHWSNFFHSGLFSWGFFPRLSQLFVESPVSMALVVVVALVSLAILLFLVWLAVASQIAIVNNSHKILKSKKEVANLNLHAGVLAGKKNFWSVFTLNLISKVLINLLVLIISLPLMFIVWNKIFSGIIYIILFVLFIPMAIALALMIKYAIAFVVLKKEKLVPALKSSWHLFRNNWIISLEMAFLLFAVSFLATLVILIAAVILAIPFFFLAVAMLSMFTTLVFWSAVMLGLIVLTAFVILCGSILGTFQVVAWTNLFEHLGQGIESKLERLLPEHIKSKTISLK